MTSSIKLNEENSYWFDDFLFGLKKYFKLYNCKGLKISTNKKLVGNVQKKINTIIKSGKFI